jgi:Zn ribbon nucleic-acid-binding protein
MKKHCYDCINQYICSINKAFVDAATAVVQSGIDLVEIRDFAANSCNRFDAMYEEEPEEKLLAPFLCPKCGESDMDNLLFNEHGDSIKCDKCGFDYAIGYICPDCGENDAAKLQWLKYDDTSVECLSCGAVYYPLKNKCKDCDGENIPY